MLPRGQARGQAPLRNRTSSKIKPELVHSPPLRRHHNSKNKIEL